jgi:hypothetical protein
MPIWEGMMTVEELAKALKEYKGADRKRPVVIDKATFIEDLDELKLHTITRVEKDGDKKDQNGKQVYKNVPIDVVIVS